MMLSLLRFYPFAFSLAAALDVSPFVSDALVAFAAVNEVCMSSLRF